MHPKKRKRAELATASAFWIAFGILSFSLSFIAASRRGAQFDWVVTLVSTLLVYGAWGPLSVVVLYLRTRFRFASPRRLKAVLLHLLFGVVIGLVHLMWVRWIRELFGVTGVDTPFWSSYTKLASKWLNFEILFYWAVVGVGYALDRRAGKDPAPSSDSPPVESPDRLPIKSGGETVFLDVATIERIEADDCYVRIHANGRSYLLRESMSGIEQKLDPQRFLRVHRSTIVNARCIRKLDRRPGGEATLTLSDGTLCKVSRRRKKILKPLLDRLV